MPLDPAMMKRYFLGTATLEERTSLENQYLSDAEAFEELVAAENDLIDSYTRGDLSIIERLEFEGRYNTSSEGRERLGFSGALCQASKELHSNTLVTKSILGHGVRNLRQPARPVFYWAGATALSVLLVLVAASFRDTRSRDRQIQFRTQQDLSRPDITSGVQPRVPPPPQTHVNYHSAPDGERELRITSQFTPAIKTGEETDFSKADRDTTSEPDLSWVSETSQPIRRWAIGVGGVRQGLVNHPLVEP
jgi:hypothetical protein